MKKTIDGTVITFPPHYLPVPDWPCEDKPKKKRKTYDHSKFSERKRR